MIRSFAIFLFVLCFSAPMAHSQSNNHQVRYIFTGKNLPLKKMTFGLNEKQAKEILKLTNGKIDFGNTYYQDAPLSQQHLFSSSAAEIVHPAILPPFTFQEMHMAGDAALLNQWWIKSLRVPQAWNYATGRGVTIADCDAGFYHDEPDLYANMVLNYRYDLSSNSPYVVDDGSMTSHGTAVAAIMAGVINGKGTSGIAYNAKVVPLQNFNYDSSDTLDKEEATARCVMRAISTPGVQIIVLENQTLTGSSETFSGTRKAVRLALQSGIIVVGAAGNSGLYLGAETSDDTGSIIVGALAQGGNTISYSNYGRRVSVAAFGEGLYTLYGRGGYMGMFGGTSGATPQVAATVALMKEVNPRLTPSQARSILERTRITHSGNTDVGGQLNSEAAVVAARSAPLLANEFSKQQDFRSKLVAILNPASF